MDSNSLSVMKLMEQKNPGASVLCSMIDNYLDITYQQELEMKARIVTFSQTKSYIKDKEFSTRGYLVDTSA